LLLSTLPLSGMQVRKLMVKLEQQQQLQQQQQQQDSGSSNDSDSEDCTNRLLASLIQVLSTTAVFKRNEHINAAWRQLAAPTAAVLEHFMHVQLLQHGAGLSDLSVSRLWNMCADLLWSDTGVFGPLLMVAVEEITQEATATPAGTTTAAAAAAASDAEASACTAAAAAAAASRSDASATGLPSQMSAPAAAAAALLTAPQVFSLCISAIKMLRQQIRDPYAAMSSEEEQPRFIAASVLECVQQAAAAMLMGSAPSEALTEQQRSFCSLSIGVPWAVLLLRCVQLGLVWLQQAVVQLLPKVQGSSGSSREAEAQQQQAGGDDEQQGLLANALASLEQLEEGLYVLGLVLGKWCAAAAEAAAAAAAEGLPTAEQPGAVVPMLLLQKQLQQLQQELLPAVQQLVQLWAAGLFRDSGEGQREFMGQVWRSCGVLSRWHFSSQSLPRDFFDGTAEPSEGEDNSETQEADTMQLVQKRVAQGIRNSTHQQQQAAVHGLQQLLSSGKLQSWLAAASSALPLRWCCNNPGCSNLVTAGSKARGSELRRVAARQCSGCQSVCYCQKVRCSILLNTHALQRFACDMDQLLTQQSMAATDVHVCRVPS
jgi:uncharacterized protein YoaH (UPF0181 family)